MQNVVRHSRAGRFFDAVGQTGVETESILVYAYILIYCFKNQGVFSGVLEFWFWSPPAGGG